MRKQTTTPKQATMLKQATEILDKIMQTANWFLTSANRFTIEKLQNNDPTLEEIAGIMESLAGIVYLLGDDFDPMMGQKANDYVYCMKNMAIAVRTNNKALLSEMVEALEKKPFC